jgi:adenylate cyclase, class 2
MRPSSCPVDVTRLQAMLKTLGASQAFPKTLFTRKIFENDALEGGAWVRLRDEGTRSTLTLKQVTDPSTIDGTTEIETEVADLRAMAEILSRLGLAEVRYQENYREEWRWGQMACDFDTWPGLPTFVEIEGPDEASVRQAAAAPRTRLHPGKVRKRRRDLQDGARPRHPRRAHPPVREQQREHDRHG